MTASLYRGGDPQNSAPRARIEQFRSKPDCRRGIESSAALGMSRNLSSNLRHDPLRECNKIESSLHPSRSAPPLRSPRLRAHHRRADRRSGRDIDDHLRLPLPHQRRRRARRRIRPPHRCRHYQRSSRTSHSSPPSAPSPPHSPPFAGPYNCTSFERTTDERTTVCTGTPARSPRINVRIFTHVRVTDAELNSANTHVARLI